MKLRDASHYRYIFFDFDGVIVDSVDAKIAAFGELYDEFGSEVRRKVEAYQRAVPGETRFDKIPRFHRDLLGISLTSSQVSEWCDRLSDIVLDQVVASPLLPDVAQVLGMLMRQGTPCFIVSGTPDDELHQIVQRKGLDPFFKSVHGSPAKKAAIVREIMSGLGIAAEDCLFIGDAMTDFDCAAECGLGFLGCAPDGKGPFPQGTHVVSRLGEYFYSACDERQTIQLLAEPRRAAAGMR